MTPLRRFTDACVRATGRRWPADIADDMVREWQAELAHLRGHRGSGFRQLAFAVSLACSPPAGSAVGWRGRLPGAGRAIMLTLLYVAVAAVAFDLQLQVVPHMQLPVRADALATLAVTMLMAAAGWLAGRRTAHASGHRPLLAAAAVVLPMAVVIRQYGMRLVRVSWLVGGWWITATAVWCVAMTFVLALARRRAAGGRPGRALLVGVGGAFAATDVAAAIVGWPVADVGGLGGWTAPLWFPLSVLGRQAPTFGTRVDWGRFVDPAAPHALVGYLMFPSGPVLECAAQCLPLLWCAVFALFATVRGGRLPVVAAQAAPSPETVVARPAAVPATIRLAGGAAVAAGALAWAAVLHWHGFDWFGFSSALGGNGLFGRIQLGALVLVGVGTAMLVAGRGPVAVPSLAAPLAMLVAARQLHATSAPGTASTALGAAVVVTAVAGAWWLSDAARRLLPQLTPAHPRRALLFVAVAAAVMIPGDIPQAQQHTLVLVEHGIAGVLGLVAAIAAVGARRPALPAPVAAVVVAIGAGAGLACGSPRVGHALYWFDFRFTLQVPLMMVLVAVATPPRAWLSWLGWVATAAVAVAAEPTVGRYALVLGGAAGMALLLAALVCRRVPAGISDDPAGPVHGLAGRGPEVAGPGRAV